MFDSEILLETPYARAAAHGFVCARMSFLTIPSQEGLFRTIKTGKSGEEAEGRSPVDAEGGRNYDDDDEDDDSENVRLIPRCSPVPRKRGQSINDETAEYIRTHLGIVAECRKKVLFADTTGGDLVDVKEFVAFDSDDEEASARWEEEEAKYRRPQREPTYTVLPEFRAPTDSALLQAVQAHKVEVEQVSAVENEPLAVSGLIRVLNISFHKSVYIRSTMDSWVTYFDHPAEYVQGSHDGSTDQFSFKLSFAPPYITHGSRIEFVVRYETSDGDYWANNSSMNYVVTLLLSYEDDTAQTKVDTQHIRSILKPPKTYSMQYDTDSEEEPEKEKGEAEASNAGFVRPNAACPVIIKPEIDVEITVHPPGPSVPPNQEPPSADGTLSAHTVLPGEQSPCTSSETTPQSNSSSVLCASESLQPNKSQPLPRLHCELGNQTSEQHIDNSPAALLPASTPPLQGVPATRSDDWQPDSDETSPSEDSAKFLLTSKNLRSATGERGSTEESVSHSGLELPAECDPSLSPSGDCEQTAAVALGKLADEISKSPTEPAAHHEGSTSTPWSLSAETEASLGAEDDAPPSPALTEMTPVSAGVTEESQSFAPQSASPRGEEENSPHISPGALIETAPNVQSDASEAQSEHDISRDLMPTAVFMSGVMSLSIVLQEPSALFFIGLLLVLHRL